MTRNDKPAVAETPDVSTVPDDWEFETVADASPTVVIFDTVGDQFVGQYKGKELIDPGTVDPETGKSSAFERFVFKGRDGELYAIPMSYKLNDAMEDIDNDKWVRITYVKDIPTGRKLNPMKDFVVEVKK
jgi:hypothetical protein